MAGGHKYRAVRTKCAEGHSHPSKGEAKRCNDLHLLQRAGQIRLLQREVPFPVHINGIKVFTYRADFVYFQGDERIIEDYKGAITPIYRLKKKCVEAYHSGVRIVEVRG